MDNVEPISSLTHCPLVLASGMAASQRRAHASREATGQAKINE